MIRLITLPISCDRCRRNAPAVKLEIAIGGLVVRTDAAIDGEHLSRLIRGAGVTMIVPGSEPKIYIATWPADFRCGTMGLLRRCRRCLVSIRSAVQPSCSGRNGRTGSGF